MFSAAEIRSIVRIANQAKTHHDYKTANLAFVGLLYAVVEGQVEPGSVYLEYENSYSGDHPYYDLPVIVVGNDDDRLCIPRPLLHVDAYRRFAGHAVTVDRREHGRQHAEEKDCFADLAPFNLVIPEGWLLPEDAPQEQWLTEEEAERMDAEYARWLERHEEEKREENLEDELSR